MADWFISSNAPVTAYADAFNKLLYSPRSFKEKALGFSSLASSRALLDWAPSSLEGADIACAVLVEGRGVHRDSAGLLLALARVDGGALMWLPKTRTSWGMTMDTSVPKTYSQGIAAELRQAGFPEAVSTKVKG